MTNKEIGEKIKTMRTSRNLTQEQLAAAINVSPSAIAMYESGNRKPKDDVAEALADVFNVPKWSIYYNESEMKPAEEPTTPEWRSLASGWGKMTAEEQQRALAVIKAMYPERFNNK